MRVYVCACGCHISGVLSNSVADGKLERLQRKGGGEVWVCVYACVVGGFRPLTSADAGLTRKREKGCLEGLVL